jgi:SAM-dependent methyltransferase
MECPVCSFQATYVRLDQRPSVPVLQNKVWPDPDSARSAPTGRLDMVKCAQCGFAWNAAFDDRLVEYDPLYDNDQAQSGSFYAHMSEMAARVASRVGDRSRIVEIGCGQGQFIEVLAFLLPEDAAIYGFDPSWRGTGEAGPDGSTIYRRYFTPETASLVPDGADIVIARHTIEHIKDPVGFLRGVRSTILPSWDARLFLETPDIDWIVAHRQIQDLFYEHCSIFSRQSLATALWKAGFEPVSIENVFGNQYFWVEARPVIDSLRDTRFGEQVECSRQDWREFVRRQGTQVYLWGAASKGVTFSILIGDGGISGVVDINARKIGKYLPVTGIPVIGPGDLPDSACVIVMNPNYLPEIAAALSSRRGIRLYVLDANGEIIPAKPD